MSEEEFLKQKDLLLKSIENNTMEHWKNYYKDVPIEYIYEDLVIDINEIKRLNQKIDKAIEYIESKNNGVCIVNGEEKGAYTFLLDFNKSREFIWQLLEILKGE